MTIGMIVLLSVSVLACDGHSESGQEVKTMDIPQEDVRPAALAGTWYEGNPDKLRDTVEQYMKHAKLTRGLGDVIGIIAPHAGHVYSGPVAGYAYKQVLGQHFDVVVVIAPNHVDPRLTFSSVFTSGAYQTPLGVIPVDSETANAIVDHDAGGIIKASDLGHTTEYGGRMEHSLEIQLPFLQTALEGDFSIVPIIMGNRDNGMESSAVLGRAIASAVKGKKALLVASSDLSHFHNGKTADSLDEGVRGSIEAYDPDGLLQDLANGTSEACGGLPMAAVMVACRELGAKDATVLHMANSGDVTGDYGNVVGYLAAVITTSGDASGTKEAGESEVGVDLGLSEDEKEVLRGVVKETLESVVNGGRVPEFKDKSGKLGEEWGAFVTLTKNGQLRGCIGHIIGTMPLIDTVGQMARAAALEDPRFPKVQPNELKDIDFEISVLTPIRKVNDIEEIVVGRDGIIISNKWARGLLLPQVATEYGWDRITFLEQTCRKAGLPKGAWKDKDTVIEMFSAEVFH